MPDKIDPLSPPKVDPNPGYIGPAAPFEKLVDSRVFVTTARVLMIIASAIGLPVAGFLMTRLVDKADQVIMKVDQSGVQLQLLEQTVKITSDHTKSSIENLQRQYIDHEGRIRIIERTLPNVPTRQN